MTEIVERPAQSRSKSAPAQAPAAVMSDSVVEFLNSLPLTGDSVEWINAFRDGLRKLLGDVDRVAVKVDLFCDLVEPDRPRNVMVEIAQFAGEAKHGPSTELLINPIASKSRAEQLLEEMRSLGTDLDQYHEPVCHDYFVEDVAYLGTIIFFRERGKPPISERTQALINTLKPFLTFVLSDVVTRHHHAKPSDHMFMRILNEVSLESSLSVQDLRILSLMLMGLSYKQAADRMDLSIDTIRKHTKRIYRKTRTGSLPELFAKYFSPRLGIAGLGEDDSL